MTAELGRSVVVERTDARRTSVEGEGARGAEGAGRVKVKLWIVEGGCKVDATTSTSRVKESLNDECETQ